MRLGLLSTAGINRKLVAGARASGRVDVVAVASRGIVRARAQADELGLARAHASYEELLADEDVDAVYVPLPNSLHIEWSVRALLAGKHVLCEKPLSRHPADVEHAFDAADAAGRVLMEGFMWRHTPQAAKLRELVAQLGVVRIVRAQFSFPAREQGDIRLSPELEGGALMDVGCYCVSAARFVCGGEPEAVTAHAVGREVDLAFAGAMRFPGGTLAHFDCAMNAAYRSELEVVGEARRLLVRDPFHSREVGIELDGERVDVPFADPYGCELEEFAAVAAGEREAAFGRADALGQARALAALHESAR
jgi:D-xylose 1-dehydrogenase (NADP+, D-xylono-1,5-lactone-forming)